MNFSIDRDILLENLNQISRGLPVKTAMPVLNGIKMELTEDDLYLTSSNTDISIQVIINDASLEVRETGKIIVPGNYFIQIIRKINSRKINISLIEDKIVVIKAERSEFKLNLLSAHDYPNIDFVGLDNPLTLSAKTIRSIIRETAYAASVSEKRPILTGVSLKNTDNKLTAIATDSFRLSQKEIELDDFVYSKEDINTLNFIIRELNSLRKRYLETKDFNYVIRGKRLLPTSFKQKRTVNTNYAELINIYNQRKNHRLKEEWQDMFCKWCEELPYFKEFLEAR